MNKVAKIVAGVVSLALVATIGVGAYHIAKRVDMGAKSYKFEAESALLSGTAEVQTCGWYEPNGTNVVPNGSYWFREDGTIEQCVALMYGDEQGSSVTFCIESDRYAKATLTLSIADLHFNTYPNFDEYAQVFVNGKAVETGIVYDGTLKKYGIGNWWIFSDYTAEREIQLEEGINTIAIATHKSAGLEGDFTESAQAGGRNLNWMSLKTSAVLTAKTTKY